jgi:hypothetical protein
VVDSPRLSQVVSSFLALGSPLETTSNRICTVRNRSVADRSTQSLSGVRRTSANRSRIAPARTVISTLCLLACRVLAFPATVPQCDPSWRSSLVMARKLFAQFAIGKFCGLGSRRFLVKTRPKPVNFPAGSGSKWGSYAAEGTPHRAFVRASSPDLAPHSAAPTPRRPFSGMSTEDIDTISSSPTDGASQLSGPEVVSAQAAGGSLIPKWV